MLPYLLSLLIVIAYSESYRIQEHFRDSNCCGGVKSGRDYCPSGKFKKGSKVAIHEPPDCIKNCFKKKEDWTTRSCTPKNNDKCCGGNGSVCVPSKLGGWCKEKTSKRNEFNYFRYDRQGKKLYNILTDDEKINLSRGKCEKDIRCTPWTTDSEIIKEIKEEATDTTNDDSSLEWWEIGLIIIGILVIMGIVIGISVILYKKRKKLKMMVGKIG